MIFSDNDLDVATRTVWGEARGEPEEGQVAVFWVIRNRAEHPAWWGRDIAGVCLAKFQFSCRNPNDPNAAKLDEPALAEEPLYAKLAAIGRHVFSGEVEDPTHGATHYKVRGTKAAWDTAVRELNLYPVSIGKHDFYALGPNH